MIDGVKSQEQIFFSELGKMFESGYFPFFDTDSPVHFDSRPSSVDVGLFLTFNKVSACLVLFHFGIYYCEYYHCVSVENILLKKLDWSNIPTQPHQQTIFCARRRNKMGMRKNGFETQPTTALTTAPVFTALFWEGLSTES